MTTTTDQAAAVPLSLDNLAKLADGSAGHVPGAFIDQLKNSPSVNFFFGKVTPTPPKPADATWTDEIATALVCSSIHASSEHGFSGDINQTAVETVLKEVDGSRGVAASQAIHTALFPSLCAAEGHTFQQYLGAKQKDWGKQLADKITSKDYINVMIAKEQGKDAGWSSELNLMFYKLHLLDPAQESRTVLIWKKALPQAVENWEAVSLLASSLLKRDQFLAQVNAVISEGGGESCRWVGGPPPGGGQSCIDNPWGPRVSAFLGGTPARMKLLS